MKYPFLLSAPGCLHAPQENEHSTAGGPPLSRRLFLKRSGGAGLAALTSGIILNQRASAEWIWNSLESRYVWEENYDATSQISGAWGNGDGWGDDGDGTKGPTPPLVGPNPSCSPLFGENTKFGHAGPFIHADQPYKSDREFWYYKEICYNCNGKTGGPDRLFPK